MVAVGPRKVGCFLAGKGYSAGGVVRERAGGLSGLAAEASEQDDLAASPSFVSEPRASWEFSTEEWTRVRGTCLEPCRGEGMAWAVPFGVS